MIASIILLLHLTGLLGVGDAVVLLIIAGAILILADFTLGLFFLASINGLLAFAMAAGLMGEGDHVFGLPIDWGLFFGVAFAEAALLVPFFYMLKKVNEKKPTTGTEGMIGEQAEILHWDGLQGKVRIQGEDWSAIARQTIELRKGEQVIIDEVDKLTVIVKAV